MPRHIKRIHHRIIVISSYVFTHRLLTNLYTVGCEEAPASDTGGSFPQEITEAGTEPDAVLSKRQGLRQRETGLDKTVVTYLTPP